MGELIINSHKNAHFMSDNNDLSFKTTDDESIEKDAGKDNKVALDEKKMNCKLKKAKCQCKETLKRPKHIVGMEEK